MHLLIKEHKMEKDLLNSVIQFLAIADKYAT